MNPYTSLWTGVREGDGPKEFHLILLDNGRTDVLADEVGRQALHCIRCSACLNVCPVYTRVGGQAYESVYPGPIGAILTPQLRGLGEAPTLPWASCLCGACYEVCPVKIDIPSVLIHLRARVVKEEKSHASPEHLAMAAIGKMFASPKRYERAQRLASSAAARCAPGRVGTARAAGPRCATCPTSPTRPSATGGASDELRARRVLGRIRIGPSATRPLTAPTSRGTTAGAGARTRRVDLFCERVADYRATVHRVPSGGLGEALAAACRERGATRLAVPSERPGRREGVEFVRDHPPLSARDLDRVDGVLTGCALGIAETGTIVLDGAAAPAGGR